jgi:hypothetical protein
MHKGWLIVLIGAATLLLAQPAFGQFTIEWVVEGLAWYLGDMDGDDVGEFAIASGDTTRFYDGSTHNVKWTSSLGGIWPTTWASGWYPYFMPPAIDFTGDGVKEIFLREYRLDNSLRIVDVSNDSVIFDLSYNCDWVQFRHLADVDGDDELELVIWRVTGPSVWDSTWVYSTGVTNQALEYEPKGAVAAHSLGQNFPNPFKSSSTTIRYTVKEEGRISLKVYNRAGQLTRTLVEEPRKPGTHVADWDGKDDRGNKVASGVYFYQMQTGDHVSSKKAIVLK